MAALRPVIVQTPRLTLTPWQASDLSDFHALHADPRTMRFFISGPYDPAAARSRLETFMHEHAGRGWTKWRVADGAGRTVGRGGFDLSDDGRHRELGYLLDPAVWGQGLATELAAALVQWHFAHPDPALEGDLLAFAHVDNAASRRVLHKTGFAQTGEGDWRGKPHAFYRLSSTSAAARSPLSTAPSM